MRNKIVTFCAGLSAGLLLLTLGLFSQAVAQTRVVRPTVKPVVRPAASTTGSGVGSSNGTGIGGANPGAGVGGTSGAGIGGGNGSGIGSPTGTVITAPSSNAAGRSNGNGVGTAATVPVRVTTDTPAVPQRTYIKELNGRCYYVTPLGAKRYVERRQCALYP